MKIIFFIIVLLLFPFKIFAESKLLINEFLIDPQPQGVEIINTGLGSIDISNWYIDDIGGATYFTIPSNTIIVPNSCLIFSGDFNLNKSSADMIRLFNNYAPPTSSDSVLIDFYSYKNSPGASISYFRLPDGSNNWTTGSANLGKFNQTNISCIYLSPTTTPQPTADRPLDETPTPSPSPNINNNPTITPTIIIYPTPTSPADESPTIMITPTLYDHIYISEIMVNPQSGQNEWVELYNDNDFQVTLLNWYIDDIENGGSSPKSFSLSIDPKSYVVFDLTINMFNNDHDSVRLLNYNKNIVDSAEYIDSQQGKTFGRNSIDSDELCLQDPSKGLSNSICISPTPISEKNNINPSNTKTPTKIQNTLRPTKPDSSIDRLIESGQTNKLADFTNSDIINYNQPASNNVLGLYTDNSINKLNISLLKSLSFASFTYSLLTLLSLSLKIKK